MPIWSVYSGYSPDFTLALPFKQLILEREGRTVLRTIHLPCGLKGVKMGHIRERDLSDGSKRFYAEVELDIATFLWTVKARIYINYFKNH